MHLRKIQKTVLIFILCTIGSAFTTVRAADLENVTATPDDASAGILTIYTIDFRTATLWPANGKILLTFPAGFDLSDVRFADCDGVSIDGGFDVDVTGQVVTVTRDATGSAIAGGFDLSISVALVRNSTTPSTTNSIEVETRENDDTNIDGPTSSSNFSIVPAALHHFTLTGFPASGVAGTDFTGNTITVTAYDQHNNKKTNYTGTISWSTSATSADDPGNYTFVAGDLGDRTFNGSGFEIRTAGAQTYIFPCSFC